MPETILAAWSQQGSSNTAGHWQLLPKSHLDMRDNLIIVSHTRSTLNLLVRLGKSSVSFCCTTNENQLLLLGEIRAAWTEQPAQISLYGLAR